MFVSEPVWILMRGAFGVAAACIYMVIESWLNDRATNENRGRIFSTYLTVNFASLIVGQMLFGTEPADELRRCSAWRRSSTRSASSRWA